nr:B12-independent methionine synthase 2 [Scrippsiella trochoidea]
MVLETTVIGSFPKPEYLSLPDWFRVGHKGMQTATKAYSKLLSTQSAKEQDQLEADVMRATREVIEAQTACGINVVTDGEVRRENYIHYLCRFIDGIDFENLTKTSIRNGACSVELPTVRGKVTWRGPLDVVAEWRKAQDVSRVPVKYTLPGPLTIIGTLHNEHYESEQALAADLAVIINGHVRVLTSAGCRHIQIDEPVFARQPEKALDWGIGMLDRCFEDVGGECQRSVHICCGYPNRLDEEEYLKADPGAYAQLAPALERCCVDAVSIEDAHRHNDLSLLANFKRTKVIFGAVAVARSRVETQSEIAARLEAALEHIDADRLIVAPDCGLAFLPPAVLKEKLTNMCAAARQCGPNCKRRRTS